MSRSEFAVHPFSADPDFDYEIRCAIGNAAGGAGDIGEVLAAVSHVRKADHEGWYAAWRELADRTLAIATTSAAGGHRVSAAAAYLRASAYYAVAVNAVSALADSDLLAPNFARQEEAWRGFVAHTAVDVDEIEIPYDEGRMPGWYFRAPSPSGAVLVVVNGSDGSRASLWASCVSAGLERGYDVLVFDGPGQQSQLFERNVPFRPDWENVLTPVFETVAAREGVDAARIVVIGISQGSYWTERALAFEHRYAAAVANPGLVDVSTSWTSQVPASMLRLLDAGENEKFDREVALGMRFSPTTAHTWRFRARPYGTNGYAETIEAVRRYTVADVAGQITTPLLILSPEAEQFWPGQSEQLAALAPGVSTVVRFTAAEGADEHCQPLAQVLTTQRVFDWLDDTLAS
ncbi:alpha/beta hydrolase family protein [Microbacterium sp.]|uniref:alpha/beta hydrolase family protein n=1 Tax=Microbacterium sp. TaxID=51671 RepID=UPI003C774885